jgi:hypothetical protein
MAKGRNVRINTIQKIRIDIICLRIVILRKNGNKNIAIGIMVISRVEANNASIIERKGMFLFIHS